MKYVLTKIAAVLLAALPLTALAQKPAGLPDNYPNKPVRIIIGLAPGGGVDILVRAVGQKLSEKWGVGILADNRPASGGVVALEALVQSAPDGYTWLAGGSQIELAAVFQRVKFDVMKSYEPIVQMTTQPYLLMVTSSLPVKSLKELVALARSKPGALNYATSGLGSAGHIGHELLNALAGMKTTHIPYKGSGGATPDLVSGRVEMSFLSTISGAALMKNGSLRAIGITSPKRMDAMPDIPTIAEQGMPDFEMANNYGLFAVAKTPVAIINAINRDVTQVVLLPEVGGKLAADGAMAVPAHTPAEYRAQVEKHIADFTRVVKASGIKPE